MPDIGWMELLVIGIVALIVVGPNELPGMFRKMGQFTGRIRAMAKDFQRAMDEAADETGMADLNRDLKSAAKYTSNPRKAGMDALKDTFGDVDLDLDDYEEGSETRRMAEDKIKYQKKLRDEAIQRRKEQTAAPTPEAGDGPEARAADPTPDPAPEPAPATTDKP